MRVLILSLLIITGPFALAQRYSVGLATAYGSEIESLGYQFRAYYNIDHKTCFGPEFTYFPTTSRMHDGVSQDISLTEFNFNGHHHINIGLEKIGVYPLGGVNYSIESVNDDNESAFGFNIGAGLHYSVKKWTIFTEVIHLTGKLTEETYLIGVFFTPLKSHSRHD